MINIAVCGIGRTGGEVIRALAKSDRFRLAAAFCSNRSDKIGKDTGLLLHGEKTGVPAQPASAIDSVFQRGGIDVFVDFSSPETTKELLGAARKHGVRGVICTTGFTNEEIAWMKAFTLKHGLGIVYAPNVTLGVNVLIAALKLVARALPHFDYQITETHHSKKTDIPSGTAKKLASVLEEELSLAPGEEVPINSVRAGGYVGLHTVMLASSNERISLVHESFSRSAFVDGALAAAQFVHAKAGWFEMEDVLDVSGLLEQAQSVC